MHDIVTLAPIVIHIHIIAKRWAMSTTRRDRAMTKEPTSSLPMEADPIEVVDEGETMTTELRTVHGRELVSLGTMAGRSIYSATSLGEAYRLTPETRAAYLLRRVSDGYSGVFGTLEEAVDHIDTLERLGE